jgi:uncharacterized membrane protein YhaH (DUF805 family)
MIEAVRKGFDNYSNFSGRATRSEYWFFGLFLIISYLIVELVFGSINSKIASAFLILFVIVTFLPSLSLSVRRLHDTDHSGHFYWLNLIPLIGPIIIIVFMATKSDSSTNRFGPPVNL